MKEFLNEIYGEMENEASKMLENIKERIESSIITVNNINNNSGIDSSNKNDDTRTGISYSPPLPLVTVIPHIIIGNPGEVIVDVANNKEKVELIIMGSTGLKGNFQGENFRKCFSHGM